MSQQNANEAGGQVILVAVYDDEVHAQHAIEQLRDKGVALDMLSVLGRVHASGDDVLGIYYSGMGSRVEAWARQGAEGKRQGLLSASCFFASCFLLLASCFSLHASPSDVASLHVHTPRSAPFVHPGLVRCTHDQWAFRVSGGRLRIPAAGVVAGRQTGAPESRRHGGPGDPVERAVGPDGHRHSAGVADGARPHG